MGTTRNTLVESSWAGRTVIFAMIFFFIFPPTVTETWAIADIPWQFYLFGATNTLIVMSMLHTRIMRDLGIDGGYLLTFSLTSVLGITTGLALQMEYLFPFIYESLGKLTIAGTHFGIVTLYVIEPIRMAKRSTVPYDRYLVRTSQGKPSRKHHNKVYQPGDRVWPGLMNQKNLKIIPRYLNVSIRTTKALGSKTYTADFHLLAKLMFSERALEGLWVFADKDRSVEEIVYVRIRESLHRALDDYEISNSVIEDVKAQVIASDENLLWSTEIAEVFRFDLQTHTREKFSPKLITQ